MPVTEQDIKGYEYRKAIADEQRDELQAVIAEIGPGAKSYGLHVIVDKLGEEPTRMIPCARWPKRYGLGWERQLLGWCPEAPAELLVRMAADQHEGYEINGERLYPFRYSFGVQPLGTLESLYKPLMPEALAKRWKPMNASRSFQRC